MPEPLTVNPPFTELIFRDDAATEPVSVAVTVNLKS